ncbi:MAG: hypothetical protein OXG04_02360 [Acidobacteria bacterium]|nr:hypothetical protein [Acidobacteriota bacterium]
MIGAIDMGNDRAATPLCVPEDVVRRLGLEEGERQWDGRPWAGPITWCFLFGFGRLIRLPFPTTQSPQV